MGSTIWGNFAGAMAQDGRTTHHLAREKTRAGAYRTHRPRGRGRQPSNPAPHRASALVLRIRQAHVRMRVVALVAALVIITGWSGAQGAERAAELDSLDRRWIQEELAAKGFDPGPVDGQFGPKTRRAIKAWQEAKGHAITGELTKGQFETLLYRGGRRVHTWPNGKRYEGDFVNGKYHGRGVHTWPSGARYKGDFRDNKRTGHGIYTWPNGNRYEGEFVDGDRTGHGIFMWASGSRYEGNFRDNKRTGHGIYTWPNGTRYEGGFVDGEVHGQGIWTFPDGNRYEVENRYGQEVSSELVVQPGRKKTEIQRNTVVRGREETVQAQWAAYSTGDNDTPGGDDTAAIGLAWGGSSKQDTVDKAISECEKAGGGDSCRRYTRAEEVPCVAVVRNTWSTLDGEGWVVLFGGLGETEDAAIADARSGSRGRDTCHPCPVYASKCAY